MPNDSRAGRAPLGLAGEISEQAVLSSYRRLARQAHPDGQPAWNPRRCRGSPRSVPRAPTCWLMPAAGLGPMLAESPGADGDDRALRTGCCCAGRPAMSPGTAVYLYGVIRDGDPLGSTYRRSVTPARFTRSSHRGLAAVLSNEPQARYEVSRKNVRGHQAVIDGVMRTTEILPTRLGTVLPSPQWVVENFLEERWSELDGCSTGWPGVSSSG